MSNPGTGTPADIHYDPNKPACLKHGGGHWTKDCPDLTCTQELREVSLRTQILQMLVAFEQHREKTGIYEDWMLSGEIESLINTRIAAVLEKLESKKVSVVIHHGVFQQTQTEAVPVEVIQALRKEVSANLTKEKP